MRHPSRTAAIALSTLAGALTLLALGCASDTIVRPEAATEDRIHVSGQARLAVVPDVVDVTLGVQTFDADAVAAVAQNNQRAGAVLAALRQVGIADADLQTASFSISPQRVYSEAGPDSVSGYWVNNTVAATVRDLTVVGAALQAAIDAGANQVQGLRFTVSNPDSLADEARRLAVVDARRRAEVLAAAAGARVGRLVSLTESSVSTPPYYRGDAAYDAAGGVPVTLGEVEITAQVTAVFAIR